ncbi:MAG TPA: Crp/Fnr family transcriptional regulator [Hansschlegelia sp.]
MDRARPRKSPEPKLPPLLAPLSRDARTRIVSHARPFRRSQGETLAFSGDPIDVVFFVEDGLVAMLARTPEGLRAEAGLVGAGGLVGHTAALNATRGLALPAEALRDALDGSAAFRDALMAYAVERTAETERLCACAALHLIEHRLARWLFRASALSGGRPIEITHQQFAVILGVRRAGVTVSLHLLDGEKAVRCQRGRVEIRDPALLETLSCGCHKAGAATARRPHTA